MTPTTEQSQAERLRLGADRSAWNTFRPSSGAATLRG
jgi:hypothetical protein